MLPVLAPVESLFKLAIGTQLNVTRLALASLTHTHVDFIDIALCRGSNESLPRAKGNHHAIRTNLPRLRRHLRTRRPNGGQVAALSGMRPGLRRHAAANGWER